MESNQQFEHISFWQLLAKTDDKGNLIKIEIPIIQRDYAQGREKQIQIREKFLQALYDAIFTQSVELDFVYGSENNSVFQPLDGQQRLTTLFLLHWYIATKENKVETAKEKLSRFTYETRTSSREFCNDLVKKGIEIEKEKTISEIIKNTAWFVSSWKKDPTISAMLVMLDAIHEKFSKADNCWEELTNNDNPPITFLYVKLENFGLSDDLYVKMNARGKQLTSFENFKSRFGKHIKTNSWEKDISNPEDKFEHRIDTTWTDLFWKYKGKDKEIDNKLVNFLAGIAINYYAENNKSPIPENIRLMLLSSSKYQRELSSLTTPTEKRIDELVRNSNDVIPEDFATKESFDYLINCLNKYATNENDKAKPNIPLWNYCDENLFEDLILGDNFTFQKRVLFYAQTAYLLKNDTFEQTYFNDWMRTIRNIVENVSGNWNLQAMIGAMRLVNELSKFNSDIYTNFANDNKIDSKFAEKQVKQEIEKAKIIIANPDAKQTIHKTEDTNFCKGEIEFALYCVDYDIDKNPNTQEFNMEKLNAIKNAIGKYLSENDVSNDFRRAFFTIGNNDFYDYWQGVTTVDDEPYPKYCMIKDINDLKKWFANNKKNKYRDYLTELIEKLSQQSIDEIIDDFSKDVKFLTFPNWKQRIIKERGLLDYSIKHYILIEEDNSCCYRLKGSKIVSDYYGDSAWAKLMNGKIY